MKNSYYEVCLLFSAELSADATSEIEQVAFQNFQCSGVLNASLDEAKVDEILGDKAYCGGDIDEELLWAIEQEAQASSGQEQIFYFEGDHAKEHSSSFEAWLKELPLPIEMRVREHELEDYNEAWRKHYQSIPVTKELTIRPSWEKTDGINGTDLFIYPGMGFGTGTHETTFLCLSLMEKYKSQLGDKLNVLDHGCGSGILGIAALKKLNVSTVDFYDIDAKALDNTRQNLEINEIKQKWNIVEPEDKQILEKPDTYNFSFANILLPILKAEKEFLTKTAAPGCYLILSGVLKDQVTELLDNYVGVDWTLVDKMSKNDWSAVILKRSA